jgi:hypothetical protein
MDVTTHRSDDIPHPQYLNYEAWRDVVRALCGRYNAEDVEQRLLPVGRARAACSDLRRSILDPMRAECSGAIGIFASMAWINTALYFRSLAEQ